MSSHAADLSTSLLTSSLAKNAVPWYANESVNSESTFFYQIMFFPVIFMATTSSGGHHKRFSAEPELQTAILLYRFLACILLLI
jgi:hypothetical protein